MQPQPHKSAFLVGLMSGTSADGIDAVVAEISGGGHALRARVVAHVQTPFSPALQRHILKLCLHGTVAEICELNFVLGEHFARAALAAIRKARLKPREITAIGSHGQTIHHLPNAPIPSTLQIGEPAIIAERTGITTIADFRVRDMAAGGQGAPLVPYMDWAVFTDPVRPRIIQNIGGIANLTFLPPDTRLAGTFRGAHSRRRQSALLSEQNQSASTDVGGYTLKDVIAFDTGPGNMVLDAAVAELSGGRKPFDKDGRWAASGRVSEKLLARMMSHPYLKRRPPKTTGREEFGEMFLRPTLSAGRRLRLPDADIIATITAFTAATIADHYRRFVFPRLKPAQLSRLDIILGGGGAKNPTLRRMLAERVRFGGLLTHEDFGIANEAKEALAFAILAYETLNNRPNNAPSATGARRAVILGKIVPGQPV